MAAKNILAADDLKPGVQFIYQGTEVEILRPREQGEDRFGRRQDLWWARRSDTGGEGYIALGPGGKLVVDPIRRKPEMTKRELVANIMTYAPREDYPGQRAESKRRLMRKSKETLERMHGNILRARGGLRGRRGRRSAPSMPKWALYPEFRCTRAQPYPRGTPQEAREGHYIRAASQAEALREMRTAFPHDIEGFTCTFWKKAGQ